MAQQTAVNWLINRFNYIRCIYADDMEDGQAIESAINIAREMEKIQIINAFKTGEYNSVDYFNAEYPHQETSENYYNETYKNEKDN